MSDDLPDDCGQTWQHENMSAAIDHWQARASKAERELEASAAEMKLAADSVELMAQTILVLRRHLAGAEEEAAEQMEWKYQQLERADAAEAKLAIAVVALKDLRDCNWTISLPDRMDAVRDVARRALKGIAP